MAVAMLYPEPGKGGRGKKNGPEPDSFQKQRLSEARTVLAALPEVGSIFQRLFGAVEIFRAAVGL